MIRVGSSVTRCRELGRWAAGMGLLPRRLGVVSREQCAQSGRSPLGQCVDCLNHGVGIGSHDQQVSAAIRARVPIGVRRPTGHEDCRSGAGFDFLDSLANVQYALQNVPCFVVFVMEMQGSDQSRRSGRTTTVLPLSNDERIADGTDD
jgi:hypothetical protein